MTSVLARYVATRVLYACGLVLALLLALFTFLSLAEALEDVGVGAFTTLDALSVVVLTTPRRALELLPVTVLLGTVLGLGSMANHRELTALRAVGVSVWRITAVLAGVTALLALTAISIQIVVVPIVERGAQEFRSRTLEQTALGTTEFWSRSGTRLLRVGAVDFGRVPRAIEIYELNGQSRLHRLVTADRAEIVSADTWVLHDVEEKLIEGDAVWFRRLEMRRWRSFLSPDQLATLIAPADAVSALDLYRYLSESRGSGVDTRAQEVQLWQQVSLPVSLLAMALLGLPLVMASVRARSAGFRTLVGGAVGIAFYLFEEVASHLAILLELEPAPTAFAPALLVLALALLGIRRV